jgi:uncharacterized protein
VRAGLRCPLLVQVASRDQVAPPAAARRAAAQAGARADVREYALDHFDVYDGIWQRRVLADQLDFLSRTLGSAHSTERRVELPA